MARKSQLLKKLNLLVLKNNIAQQFSLIVKEGVCLVAWLVVRSYIGKYYKHNRKQWSTKILQKEWIALIGASNNVKLNNTIKDTKKISDTFAKALQNQLYKLKIQI